MQGVIWNKKTKQNKKQNQTKQHQQNQNYCTIVPMYRKKSSVNITPLKDQGSAAYYMPYTIGKYDLKYTSRIVTNG